MANTWGTMLRLSIFGESHGPAIGIVIDGLPAGEAIDMAQAQAELKRRAPGKSPLVTTRQEPDIVEVLSGVANGKTTGAPLCGMIRNGDARSRDYDTKLRPGHADLTALLKYGGNADMRGGGHFSGRLTGPLVFAGAVAKQLLCRKGVEVYGRITEIAGIVDDDAPGPQDWRNLSGKAFPTVDAAAGERMQTAILAAKSDRDSVGGVVEAVALGTPPGLGEPFFRSVESVLACLLFSVPAVKGVTFGDGFSLSRLRGSQANDEILLDGDRYTTRTNRSGGILGGITNGMPLVVQAAFKPTPTISLSQRSVDTATGQPVTLESAGRHDPCIVPRAVPVVEACTALCLLDLYLENKGRLL